VNYTGCTLFFLQLALEMVTAADIRQQWAILDMPYDPLQKAAYLAVAEEAIDQAPGIVMNCTINGVAGINLPVSA